MSDWLSFLSLLFAAVAAWGAVEAVRQSRRARYEDSRGRHEARLDREWQQLDRIGDLVETVFSAAAPEMSNVAFSDNKWRTARNRLRQLLAGSEHALPNCQSLVQSTDSDEAYRRVPRARAEVEEAMRQTIGQIQDSAPLQRRE